MSYDIQEIFLYIISRASKDNTYKFALAKFLLDYSQKHQIKENLTISYKEIAEAFLKYYWFQECKYKIKQDFKTSSQPVVISIIQKYCGTEYIPQSYEKYFKKNKKKEEIERAIESQCLKDVIPRFQPQEYSNIIYLHHHIENGKRFKMPQKDERYITLTVEAHIYFKDNYTVLNKLLILEWAKFLEKTNFTPRLISKIESFGEQKRSSLTKYRKILKEIDNTCFYCHTPLEDKKIHVDHFIPWSYIFEDEKWNLVLSCDDCNLKKSDSLAHQEYLEKIHKRNEEHNLNTLNKDIFEIYENCKKSGFLLMQ